MSVKKITKEIDLLMNDKRIKKIEKVLLKQLKTYYPENKGELLYVDINNVYVIDETKSLILSGNYGRKSLSKEENKSKDYYFDERFCLLMNKKNESLDFLKGMFSEIIWERIKVITDLALSSCDF